MDINSVNPKLTQDPIAKELSCSSSAFHRHRQDINMLSTYKVLMNSNKRRKKTSSDRGRPRMTS